MAGQSMASAPLLVVLAEDVEQEGVHVVVQCFVVQEQLGQQAQALAVHLRFSDCSVCCSGSWPAAPVHSQTQPAHTHTEGAVKEHSCQRKATDAAAALRWQRTSLLTTTGPLR